MIIKSIIEGSKKWEIYKENNLYYYKYYEYFNGIGWRLTGEKSENYTQEAIEYEFDIAI